MDHKKLLTIHKEKIAKLLNVPVDSISIFRQMQEMKEHHAYYAVEKHSSRNHGYYQVKLEGNVIASWNLQELPFCCAYLISGHARVEPKYRNRGLGSLCNEIRQDVARQLGYTAILCTDVLTNVHQRALLKKQNFNDIHEVKNKRTSNQVFLSVKLL